MKLKIEDLFKSRSSNKNTVAFILAVFLFLIFGGRLLMQKNTSLNTIKMGLPIHWRNLHPGLQHTLAGDLVLSNQFDSLVGMDSRGIIMPIGAKSWTFNDSFTDFTFKIDTSKRFSDGSYLNAGDFKTSWEKSLSLEPISSNNSLLDVLYKIKGFSDFEKTGKLIGVEVIDNETLVIHFSTPFRMALDHLTGNRFAAFKEVNGQYIGTGKFIVQSEGPDKLTLVPQPYSEVKNKISLEFIPPQKIGDAITKGQIDCIPYIQGTMVNGVFDPHEIQVIAGQEASHMALNINNLTGRLFNKLELRKALQSLVWQKILDGSLSQINSPFFQFDAQVFMDGQTGRIDQTVVEKIINEGRDWIPDLISETQKHPLLVFAHEGAKGVFEVFKNLNLPIVDDSRVVDQKTFLENVYKEFKPDILIGAFSIANGDPDGIYHRLGKNGAILSPMSFSSSVGDLLEEGRKIIDISKLDSHYKKVSEKILEDVPFVHLGFSKAVAIVRKDKVNFNTLTLRRNEGHLEVFELK